MIMMSSCIFLLSMWIDIINDDNGGGCAGGGLSYAHPNYWGRCLLAQILRGRGHPLPKC